jgi:ribosomal protein L3 glutamine methyltransferase
VTSAAELIEETAARLTAAGVWFGHGTDSARDEAAFLVLHALDAPFELARDELERARGAAELARVEALVCARIERRVPAAYLTRRMWFAGHELYVDERVLVPRSPLAELIANGLQPWRGRRPLRSILDVGTGSGCIAIACALELPDARVDATDISAAALEVAAINVRRHGVEARVRLLAADLFPGPGASYDLVISNPPYVPTATLARLPPEYRHEPELALAAGRDGLDCIRRILGEAHARLGAGGLLVMEVGEMRDAVARAFPRLPFNWVELEHGGEGVFVLEREELEAASS